FARRLDLLGAQVWCAKLTAVSRRSDGWLQLATMREGAEVSVAAATLVLATEAEGLSAALDDVAAAGGDLIREVQCFFTGAVGPDDIYLSLSAGSAVDGPLRGTYCWVTPWVPEAVHVRLGWP